MQKDNFLCILNKIALSSASDIIFMELVLTTKQKIISAYFFVGLLFATYGWLFGQFKYRGFMYNLGRGIVWPVHMFPVLGSIITAILILAFVGWVVFSGKK